MRRSISREKINQINGLLANQKRQLDRQLLDEPPDQEEALRKPQTYQNGSATASRLRHQPEPVSFFSERQISAIPQSKSRLMLRSEAKGKMEEVDELMQIDLKPQSKMLTPEKRTGFRKYQFKSKQLSQFANPKDLIQSKVAKIANQSPEISKLKTKKLVDISYDIVRKYFSSKIVKMNSKTQASEIFQIINPLFQLCKMELQYPLVKLYRNCVYFGEHSKSSKDIYEGILIFYEKKRLYYGQFLNEKKHGFGIQIDFNDNSVYIGRCHQGQKLDDFQVIKPNEVYRGPLSNWLYEGYGELKTKYSTYKGYFEKGERHGEGKEYFPDTGLTIAGTFIHNLFSNDQQQISKSRSKDLKRSNANKMKLNPEEGLSEFNYDFAQGSKSPRLQREPSDGSSFRIKLKGHIRKQNVGRKISISQQDRLYNINNRK